MSWVFLVLKRKGLDEKVIQRYKNLYEKNLTIVVVNGIDGKCVNNSRLSMKNKLMVHFSKNRPKLDISIRLLDSVAISSREMKFFDYRTIGEGNIINILYSFAH